ncbi:Response regulator receiver domain-containing protein [Sulfitobacter marinus]|uniref:Response regulator receiver domain-containing protein n=1 Tax=Sulfitobacter marinus TaxID=394264 RepID=A0A1I6TJ32_9RHOB|nr:response regulator [Sulfitobacter marinus]SFS89185.1 Response regulator receiver domain-containing protein [Sulfitobacter marinus]
MPRQQNANIAEANKTPLACLIIEDSTFDQVKMTRIIHRNMSDTQIYVATTLREARQTLAKYPVSVILLDNHLPDGLGADFAVELAELKIFSHIAVVMVSDWPTPFMWAKAATAGVLHVINKSEFDQQYILDAFKHAQKMGKPRLH